MRARSAAGAGRLADVELPERYELIGHIANGGMASVWCAEDHVLGRRVAIKLLGGQYAADEEAKRRFEREARAGARVSAHPNVVTIYDFGVAGSPDGLETPYIVMEYLTGGTAADALRTKELGPEDVLPWVGEAADALDHAHALGVIHRDVKPANLLLDGSRSARVGDFGIATLASESAITSTGVVLGTMAYLPPEQATGAPASAAGDRYALAVVGFELLAGRRPFAGDAWLSRGATEADAPPRASQVNPRLPAAIDPVLARGMAHSPADRFPSAREFADQLTAAYRSRTAVPPAPPYRAYRAGTRAAVKRSHAAALGALAAAALAAGIVAGTADGGSSTVPGARAVNHRHAAAAHATGHKRQSAHRQPAATVQPSAVPAQPASPQPAPPGPPGPKPGKGPKPGHGSKPGKGPKPGHGPKADHPPGGDGGD